MNERTDMKLEVRIALEQLALMATFVVVFFGILFAVGANLDQGGQLVLTVVLFALLVIGSRMLQSRHRWLRGKRKQCIE